MPGVPQTFDDYIVEGGAALLRFAYLLAQDKGRAEDLVQEALMKAHRRWGGRTRVEHPDAYVRRIVLNEFVSWRRRRSNSELPGPIPDDLRSDTADQFAERDLMWRVLRTLPPRQRAVLVLRYYEELTDREIGIALGCAEGSVRSLASRAFRALRSHPYLNDRLDASAEPTSIEETL